MKALDLRITPEIWSVADYDFSHPAFDTDWRAGLVQFGEDKLSLSLVPHSGSIRSANRFEGASVRTRTKSHFGRYEAQIRPARGDGIVTGFFVYTGPAYGSRHDEIDIEFLGHDTRRVHVAWFHDGNLTAQLIDLGFDAADSWNSFAFDWFPDRIVWYVNGQPIFETTAKHTQIPQMPSLLFANIWATDPSIKGWAGLAKHGTKARAEFRQIRFTPLSKLEVPDLWAAKERTATKVSAPRQLPE